MQRSPFLATATMAHVGLLLVLVMLYATTAHTDPVQIMGVNRWIKPIKFSASIAIYLGALAWYAPQFGVSNASRWALGIAGWSMIVEIVAIVLQAARGTTSHYNIATPFDGILFSVMGMAIALNTLAMVWCAWLAWNGYRSAPDPYRLGIVLGLLVAVGGSAIGGLMISNNAHTVGAPDGGPGLPVLNWSTVAGDLRISHFIGLHALQALPVIGVLFGARAVLAACLAWLVLTGLTLAQAMAGKPLW